MSWIWRTGNSSFLREIQEVYEWACDTSGPGASDPFVYERVMVAGQPWLSTGVRLSAFLVTVAGFEAVVAADHCINGGELAQATRDEILLPLKPLPVPGPTVNARLYAGDADLLAFAGPNIPGDQIPDAGTTWWIYLAAHSPAHTEYAERLMTNPRP